MSNKVKAHKTGESSNHSIPNFIAVSLYKLIQNRNREIGVAEEHEVKAINYSILMMINSMIEGFMQDLLKNHLDHIQVRRYWNQKKIPAEIRKGLDLENKLYGNLINEIKIGTWGKLTKQFKLVFGKSIDSYVGTKIYNSMHCQFVLRNMIAHGNTIEVDFLKDGKDNRILEFNRKYEFVFQYLIDNKLIAETIPTNLKLTRMFETKAVDHFVKNSIAFIENLLNNLEGYTNNSMPFILLGCLASTKDIYDE